MTTERAKNKKGQFVAKRYDTKIGTIEAQYNIKLGVKSNMELGKYLKLKGYGSLSEMLKSS